MDIDDYLSVINALLHCSFPAYAMVTYPIRQPRDTAAPWRHMKFLPLQCKKQAAPTAIFPPALLFLQ